MVVTHRTEYLAECLDSVVNQTVAPSSVVVVDNASGSETVHGLARRYGFPTIRLDSAVAVNTARNIGCSALDDCDLIVNLDGDDLIKPRFLEVYWSTARERKADVVFGAAELIGARTGLKFTREQLRRDLRGGNYVSANSLFKRRLWREVGGFDPSIRLYEDWDFWLSLAERRAVFEHVDEPLWCYRQHQTGTMARSAEEEKIRSRRLVRRKHRRYFFGLLQWRRLAWKFGRVVGREP
jgi:glycosyltransferase involved in cell wall biosynthesis